MVTGGIDSKPMAVLANYAGSDEHSTHHTFFVSRGSQLKTAALHRLVGSGSKVIKVVCNFAQRRHGAMAMLAGIVLLAVTACTLVGSILESESLLLGKQGPGSGQGSGPGDESLQVSELYYIIHVILPKGFTSDLCMLYM